MRPVRRGHAMWEKRGGGVYAVHPARRTRAEQEFLREGKHEYRKRIVVSADAVSGGVQ